MKNRLYAFALTLACAAGAPAQNALPGDLLVASSTGGATVMAVTPGANVARTLASMSPAIRGLVVGADNTNYFAASGLDVFRIDPNGGVTTVVAGLSPGIGVAFADLDENGDVIVGTGWASAGSVFRVNPVAQTWTTIARTGIFANALCLDRDSGDIVVADNTSGSIFRIDRNTGQSNTVQTGLPTVYAMDYHPFNGEVLLTTSSTILRLDAFNALTTFVSGAGLVKSLAVLANGDVIAGPHGTTMQRYDAAGQNIGTPYNGANITKMDMAVADENHVWALNSAIAGTPLSISVRFARHPGKLYIAAASFSRQPGIPIDSRTVPLTPDNLFRLSQSVPALFQGFAGALDAQGRAGMNVLIPALPIQGLRMFLAAVVVDPAAPSGIAQISQPYGITVQ